MRWKIFYCFFVLNTMFLAPKVRGEIPVPFTLDRPGFVTLVIEAPDGRRVKNLIQDTYFEAGKHAILWGGYNEGAKRDEEDLYDVHRKRIAAGKYVIRGLVHDDIQLRYKTKVQSPGNPPWHTSDRTGAWLADHTPPIDVLSLPNGSPYGNQPQVLITAPTGEAGHSAIWLTLEGKKLYGTKMQGWRSAKAMAVDEGTEADHTYYGYGVLEKPSGIFGFRRKQTPEKPSSDFFDRVTEIEPPALPENVEPWPWLIADAKLGLAIRNRIALLSFTQANRIQVYDLQKKKKEGLVCEIEIESPRGMAFDHRGRLLLLSGKRLLRFDDPRPVAGDLGPAITIESDLYDPNRVIVGPDGTIYVSEGGSCSQVKVFNAGEHFLRIIGEPGGKQFGKYNEQRMHNPAGMAIDAEGRLWVAELDYGPKRISVWNAETGEWIRADYGPPKYGGGGHLDPRDPTRFYYSSGLQGVEFQVDWAPGPSKPVAIYSLQERVLGRTPGTPIYRDGRQYMINRFFGPSYFLGAASSIFLYEDDTVRCLARIGTLGRKSLGPWLREHAERDPKLRAKMQEAFELYDGDVFVAWSDVNGDREPQAGEVQWRDMGRPHRHGRPAIARDFSVTTTSSLYLPPPTWTKKGIPVWDLDALEVIADRNAPLSDVIHTADDTFVLFSNYTKPKVMRAYRNGRLIWKFNAVGGPGRPNPIATYRGQLISFSRSIGFPFTPKAGEGGEMFAFKGYHGSVYVMTADGLYVTDLGGDERTTPALSLPEARQGMIVDDVSFKSEHFWPAIDQMEDGTIYLSAGKECSCFFEVLGFETIHRLPEQTLTVAPEQLDGLPDVKVVPGESRSEEKSLQVKRFSEPPQLDGRLDEWTSANWVEISPHFGFRGALGVSDGTLYAAWKTGRSDLLKNSSADGWRYLFATGGALDLMLRTDPSTKKPKRQRHGPENQQAADGDIRILVTRIDDPKHGPVRAIYFEQEGDEDHPYHYNSPVGEVKMANVQDISNQVRLAQQQGNFELAIPLELLGWEEVPKKTLGDIGIVIGTGAEAHARFYWSNKASSVTSDIPTEARLLPVEWGHWEFE